MVTNPMINTATATDPASAPATGSDSDARTAVAALAVAKTDGSATYTPGNNATYNVVVTNTGPSHASSVTVTDPLPAGVTLSANATCVASGGDVRRGYRHNRADKLRHDGRNHCCRRG